MAVIVYSIPHCPKCAAAKALLKRKGISFEESSVSENEAKKQEMAKKLEQAGSHGASVMMPVLDIEGTIIEGFDRQRIEQALKEKGIGS